MRRAFLVSIVVSAGISAAFPAAADGSRNAAIRSALAQERGEITVLEASPGNSGGVYVGFSSGALLNCDGDQACRGFTGVPDGAVDMEVSAIVVSRRGEREIVWVSYPHGVLYRCADYHCEETGWADEQDE